MTTPQTPAQQVVANNQAQVAEKLSVTAAVAAYIAAMAKLRATMVATLEGRFRSLGSWRDADAARFQQSVLPLIEGAKITASQLTSGYLQRYMTALAGSHQPITVNPNQWAGDALRGVDPADLYQRPFEQLWYQLSQGAPLQDAVDAGINRLQSLATTDIQLAATHTAQQVTTKHTGVVGYRRILTGPYNCGMCIIASTQRYHKADLLPIHPGCDCVVGVILGDQDPGRVINSHILTEGALSSGPNQFGVDIYNEEHTLDAGDLLPAVHQSVKDTLGKFAPDGTSIDYRKLILVRNNTEIGPVLTVKGEKFTKAQRDTGNLAAKPRQRQR